MKAYIQFWKESFNWDGKQKVRLIPDCGDRSVVILDGRNNIQTMINDGFTWLSRRQSQGLAYLAFTIHKGDLKSSTCIYKHIESYANKLPLDTSEV